MDDMEQIAMHAVERAAGQALPRKSSQADRHKAQEEAVQGFSVEQTPKDLNPKKNADNPFGSDGAGKRPGNTIPGPGHELSIMLDGSLVGIRDQIHMYTTNQLLSHPLVSPVLQPSLGGLPPLLILTGGGEVLRDEQIYLAHKAANPAKYPPGEAYLDEYPEAREIINKWKPTDVQLQVWDDLCHVAPTLSFTRPAKYMYRSIAQFGAWVLARAQKTEIQIMDDDEMSIISSGSESSSNSSVQTPKQTKTIMKNGVTHGGTAATDQVGRAGEPLPPFKNHMIRQRVDRHGQVFPLDPPSSLPALQMPTNEIGVIKPQPVRKWLNAKKEWDTKYAREKRKVQKQRAKEMARGYQNFGDDEVPPPSALAGRRGLHMPKEEKKGRSWGMSLWSLWGSSHDESTISREEKADKEIETTTATETDGTNLQPNAPKKTPGHSRSRSRRRNVTDTNQTDPNHSIASNTPATPLDRRRSSSSPQTASSPAHPAPAIVISAHDDHPLPNNPDLQTISSHRPVADGKAVPFKLSSHLVDDGRNASTVTLQSQVGVARPVGGIDGELGKGDVVDGNTGPARSQDQAQATQGSKVERGGDGGEFPREGRRGTVEDARGVLHHGLEGKGKDG
ncbi:hypothetical protein ACLMJK_007728 [Lecanora helva]